MTAAPEFDRSVSLAEIPGGGLALDLTASDAECAALARRYGVLGVSDLAVKARLRPLTHGRYRLKGRVQARVRQTCVVTLEPTESDVGEDFDVTFQADAVSGRTEEVEVDALGDDPPEPVQDGRIPVGETAAQYLALAIDPFPRAPGAVAEIDAGTVETTQTNGEPDTDTRPESRPDSPFAILRKLR